MRIRRTLAVVAMTAAALSVGTSVQAATPPATQVQARAVTGANHSETATRISVGSAQMEELMPYLDQANKLDASRALAHGVDRRVVADYLKGYDLGRSGARACRGAQGFYRKFVHMKVYLNSCTTANLLYVLALDAGVVTIAGIIAGATGIGLPITAVMGVAVVVIGLSAATVTRCSYRGYGMVVQNIYLPPCYNQG